MRKRKVEGILTKVEENESKTVGIKEEKEDEDEEIAKSTVALRGEASESKANRPPQHRCGGNDQYCSNCSEQYTDCSGRCTACSKRCTQCPK